MRKKVKVLKIGLIAVSIMFLMALAAFIVTRMTLDEELVTMDAMADEMARNKQTVYVVSTADGEGIPHGDTIREGENVIKQTVYTGLEGYYYISEEELGTTAIVDIDEGMTVMKNMVTSVEISTDTREYEMQVVNLMVDQKENDVVDIRIMYPDGSDYLVLPKKTVKNLNLENCVFWTYLNEEEILRMASATIDAFTVTGTKIYATRYVEDNLQDEAIPTYLVNASVQDMMDSSSAYYDQNLLTKAQSTLNEIARKNLETRLSSLSEEKLEAVNEGHGLEDTAKSSVLTGLGGYDYENALEENSQDTMDDTDMDSVDEGKTDSAGSSDALDELTTLPAATQKEKEKQETNEQMEKELNSLELESSITNKAE